MLHIMKDAGYLLSHSLDKLEKNKKLNPIYVAIKNDRRKIYKELDEPLEISIPKAIKLLEEQSEDKKCAAVVYPAELKDENCQRYSVLIIHILKYSSDEYISVAQPYSFKGDKIIPGTYELLDYNDFLEDKLELLEELFVTGIFSHENAENIWKGRFVTA